MYGRLLRVEICVLRLRSIVLLCRGSRLRLMLNLMIRLVILIGNKRILNRSGRSCRACVVSGTFDAIGC